MTIFAALIAMWLAHPGRILDGDTFEASVQVWTRQTVTTKIRLSGIDAPELFRPKCEAEKALAIKARDFTSAWLARGPVYLSGVKEDVYAGRVDAIVSDPNGAMLGPELIAAGLAVVSTGARTKDWCAP